MPADTQCYQCGRNNSADQAFCGACGSPLSLSAYLDKKVKDQLHETIQDRDVLEMDSSIKVFQQAWGWIRLIFGIVVGLLVLTGAGVFWKASDFWSSVDKAKQTVVVTANQSSGDIHQFATQAQRDIANASAAAVQQTQALKNSIDKAHAEVTNESGALRDQVRDTQQRLQSANRLEPEIDTLRQQLSQARTEIQQQQKVISSSQDFVKSVFSSHRVEFFNIGQPPTNRYAVVPPATKGNPNTIVWLLLQDSPIEGTLQLQYFISVQPPNSYLRMFHNLVVFFWGDPPDNLKQKSLSVSYFPDTNDTDTIHALSEHDGRVWADDQPLPKVGEPDPDFKGNKWMPMQQSTPAKP
jgi:hypothetical protein